MAATILPLSARDKKAKADPKDAIQVVGHIPLTGGPVTRFFTTQHYSSTYLYAEHQTGGKVTLIDVSRASQPKLLAEVAYGASAGEGLSLVAGTSAMVTSEASPAPAAPQSIKIMDFSDPAHPRVAREFSGVTAMSRDDRRGLIFVANADGIWVLQQHLAEDPEVERAYAYQVVYGMSMRPPE
ncbi:MAG TPA: hypothetical protein VKX39_00540 [Bryobacteraceae bacterium]|jgi:hypothetical protein|nr:hypothetical protein [Bryobacteraceae bacterium]